MLGCRKGEEQTGDAGARYAGEGEGGVWARSPAQWCHFRHWAPEQNSSSRYLQLHGGALDAGAAARKGLWKATPGVDSSVLLIVTFSLPQSNDLRIKSL